MKQVTKYFKLICLLFSCLCIHSIVYAQSIDLDPASKTIDGISNIAASIVADSFVPMTHYNKDNYMVSIVPAYYTVQKAYDDPQVEGKDLKGFGAGAGFGYATSDRLLIYGIAAYMHIDGKLLSTFYEGLNSSEYPMDVNYSIFSVYSGLGYDIIESEAFSLPVFTGIFFQKYNGTGSLPEILNTRLSVDSSGTLFGVSFAIAPSFKYNDLFKITPYYLFSYSLNEPDASAKITTTVPFNISTSYELSTSHVKSSMAGLALTWLSSKSVSLSLSLGGWIRNETSWYNKKFLDGLQIKSAVLVVSFNN